MQKAEPLADDLRFVLALDSKAKRCVQRPKSGLEETAQHFVGIRE